MAEWIISSSVLIAVMLLLRLVLRGRIGLRLQYALWGLVLLRLLVPVSFGSTAISVGNLTQRAAETEPVRQITAVTEMEAPIIRYRWTDDEAVRNDTGAAAPVGGSAAQMTEKESLSVAAILKLVWLCGIAAVGAWFLLSNLRMARSLRKSRVLLDGSRAVPIYVSGAVDTPCLFGLLRPAIYLTGEVAENGTVARHAVEHELTHCRHRDNIWALLRCVCLAAHWYNPLVWCAAICSRNDAELACDEATIKRLGEGERADYGRTLIRLTCEKRPALLNTATTMTGSGKSIKTRIALIVKKPKMAVYTAVTVVLIAAVTVGCTFTGANEPENGVDGMTVYDCGGLSAAIPGEYVDELLVYAGAETGEENVLLKVYGRAATEAFAAAGVGEDDSMGWIFSIVRRDQAWYDENVSSVFVGGERFARDDTWYYCCVQSSDSTFYPTGDMTDQERWEVLWTTMVEEVKADFITRNSLTDLNAEIEIDFSAVESLALPEAVTAYAADYVQRIIDYQNECGREQGYSVTDARITALEVISTGAAGLDDGLSLYRLEYRLQVNHPEKVALAGGMQMEDGWLTEWNSAGQPYLLLHWWGDDGWERVCVTSTDEIDVDYGAEEMLAQYGDKYTAAAMELYAAYQAAQVLLPENVVSGILGADGGGRLTLYLPDEGACGTYTVGEGYYTGRLTVLSQYYAWTRLDAPPTEPDEYWLTLESADGVQKMTFHANGGMGTVECASGGKTAYWEAEPLEGSAEPIADDVRRVYDNLETDDARICFHVDGGAEAAAEYFVQNAFGEYRMSLTSGNWYRYTDYALIDWGVDAVGGDDLAVAGWFQYAFVPEVPDTPAVWAGSGSNGTGEYEGMVLNYFQFVLQKQADGYWHCVSIGTGGNTSVLNSLYDAVQ